MQCLSLGVEWFRTQADLHLQDPGGMQKSTLLFKVYIFLGELCVRLMIERLQRPGWKQEKVAVCDLNSIKALDRRALLRCLVNLKAALS